MFSLRRHNFNWCCVMSCFCFYTSQQEKEVKLQHNCLTSFSCQSYHSLTGLDEGHNTGNLIWCFHFATTTTTDTVWGAALAFILANRKRKSNYNKYVQLPFPVRVAPGSGGPQYWRPILMFSLRHHNFNWHSVRSCSCFYTSQQEKEVKLQRMSAILAGNSNFLKSRNLSRGKWPKFRQNLTSSYLWRFLTDFVQILRADSLSPPMKLLLHGLWN